ncbi:uncharacterized protein LOC105276697 [Ooceraea biroi]|uniref:uncharacterized protein LOC105276697 n=1 Tax=Ooceraea biroi TaxID=2015173 RepID=UPI000F08DB71|nr:uncharacterized protein LOC105276697 [Ooceraea biroi]
MPGIASATGLLSARTQPVRRLKPKNVELSGHVKTAPFALRPFAGLFNPYPYSCSVLCNHPADCEAKEVVRRAKDTWATEGKALLLPEEVEMIRSSLLAVGAGGGGSDTAAGNANDGGEGYNTEATVSAVPEEFFRKYTETDSRPLTPAPTLASGPTALTGRTSQEHLPATCNPRERTTLILDLRANPYSQQVDTETFSWHALTLEPPPVPRKTEIFICKPIPRSAQRTAILAPPPPSPPSSAIETCDTNSSKNAEKDVDSDEEQQSAITRRGKRLRKRKSRRGSTYGQQTEVRDPLEPVVTQVSQTEDTSRRSSLQVEETNEIDSSKSPKRTSAQPIIVAHVMPESFLAPEILKYLSRELDREKVEAEFSIKRRIALEEALRVKGDVYSTLRGSRQPNAGTGTQNAPRVFSRQVVRFELLDGQSLRGLTSLQYLNKHAYVTSGRKLIFGRIFNRFIEESSYNARRISPNDIEEALQEVIGKALTDEQKFYLKSVMGEVTEPLDFREWCGLCAVVERLLCPLPSRESDPPVWLERADFEGLERRLKSAESVDSTLALLLKEIRDR